MSYNLSKSLDVSQIDAVEEISNKFGKISKTQRIETTFGSVHSSVTTHTIDDVSSRQQSNSSFSSFCGNTEQINTTNRRPLTRSDSFNYFQSKVYSTSSSTLSNLSNTSVSLDEEIPLLFVDIPSEQLLCKICQNVYQNPFMMSCGHSFCRKCTFTNEFCPIHDKKMTALLPNLALEDQIGTLLIYCRYGCKLQTDSNQFEVDPNGCPLKIKLSDRKKHEDDCKYAPVSCPNNPNCPKMIRLHLAAHLKTCQNISCDYKRFGCKFVGDKTSLVNHTQNCRYELVKEFLHNFDDQVKQLKIEGKQKDDEIYYLRTMLSKMNEKIDENEKNFERRLELLTSNQSKLVDELDEFKQQNLVVENQLQELNTRLHMGGGVGVFDPQQIFKCKGTFVGHSGPVWCLCAHGDYLFSGSSDKQIKVWDTATNFRCQKTLEGHDGIVLALTAYNDKLFSGSADSSIKVS